MIIKVVEMEDIINRGIPEEMYRIKLLAAIGLYKTKSEELKKGIRQLQYGRIEKIEKVKEILDEALKKENLSSLIRQMREEEMH
jgi:Arc/MetJ-type ribon-helix-helix transcriptional regulator